MAQGTGQGPILLRRTIVGFAMQSVHSQHDKENKPLYFK